MVTSNAQSGLNFSFGALTESDKGEAAGFVASEAGATALLNDISEACLSSAPKVGQMTSSVVQRSCEYNYGDFSVFHSSIGLELTQETLCSHVRVSMSESSSIHLSPVLLEPSCLIESVRGMAKPEQSREMLNQNAPKNFYFNSFVTSQAMAFGAIR